MSTSLLMSNDPDWQKVFEDQQFVVFTRVKAMQPNATNTQHRDTETQRSAV